MLIAIHPKLPMKDVSLTKDFYLNKLKFELLGDYGNYLIVGKDKIEIHFFEYKDLDAETNYGQVYIRTNDIDAFYRNLLNNKINGHVENKPWGQREFSLLDPDNNLLTFGQNINE